MLLFNQNCIYTIEIIIFIFNFTKYCLFAFAKCLLSPNTFNSYIVSLIQNYHHLTYTLLYHFNTFIFGIFIFKKNAPNLSRIKYFVIDEIILLFTDINIMKTELELNIKTYYNCILKMHALKIKFIDN